MSLRVANMPEGLRALIPPEYTPGSAEFVVLDRRALEHAKAADDAATEGIQLVEAYGRALGSELVSISIASLPEDLRAAAQKLAPGLEQITGQAVLNALGSPGSVPADVRVALPDLAEAVREQMGKDELAKGSLKTGLPARRATQEELSRWFTGAVADIRASSPSEPVSKEGAERLIKATKGVLLNFGAGLITRAFFDEAVQDLHHSPGLSDDAIAALSRFRVLTQPGRTSHERTDKGALVAIDSARRREAELGLLNETQKKALEVSNARAKAKVPEARQRVIAKIKSWGYTEADLDKVIAYIQRHARVTIQFHPDKTLPDGGSVIDSFLADPNYKNQFQTKISSGSLAPTAGSCRDGWEKELFEGAYHTHELIPEERPRYGGLSPINSPKGNGGVYYGRCFFELRQDVKFRTTFTPRNSSSCKKDDVTTIDSVEVLLDQMTNASTGGGYWGSYYVDDDFVKSTFEVALGQKVSIDRAYKGSYIEAQIHGTVDLARDVDFLVIDHSYLMTPHGKKLLELAEKIGATVKYTDQAKFYLEES